MNAPSYQSYKNLPPIAGVCSMPDAMNPGLAVEECVRRQKRVHYALKRLHEVFISRITSEPIMELKNAFSLHSYICAEHVAAIRKRVGEMREPPLHLDTVPDESLEIFFDEILGAPTTEELVLGIYHTAVPAVIGAIEGYLRDTNNFVDYPSCRVMRFALLELNDIAEFGRQAVASLADLAKSVLWLTLLDDCLAAAGGLDGTAEPLTKEIQRQHSARPYLYDRIPQRDSRFPDPYNMGVNAEAFLYDPEYPPLPKTLMMFYKRLRELDVPEMMASIIVETKDQPWDYYRDMTRQLWDEARHSIMGEVGFASLGVDWHKVMVNFTWSLGLNTQLKPFERHAVLYFIEQGLMPKTGKRYEWEVGKASGSPLSALFQDFDWADEVLHARIGRDWYVSQFRSAAEAIAYGDKCWTKVLLDWKSWRDQGLTAHRNWWPEVYQEACDRWGVAPDPKILAYNTTYETLRADLKAIAPSA